jgi:hypothetical protein
VPVCLRKVSLAVSGHFIFPYLIAMSCTWHYIITSSHLDSQVISAYKGCILFLLVSANSLPSENSLESRFTKDHIYTMSKFPVDSDKLVKNQYS